MAEEPRGAVPRRVLFECCLSLREDGEGRRGEEGEGRRARSAQRA